MNVKGTAVKSLPDFIKKKHPEQLKEWIDSLPPASKKIFVEGVSSAKWYKMDDALTIPTSLAATMFFGDEKKGAWELGRYSAESALNGIYKLYVKLSSPQHIIERGSRIFSAYYQGSTIEVVEKNKDSVQFAITEFATPNEIIEYRIAGWMEKAIEISGQEKTTATITKSLTKGDDVTLYVITW